MAKQTTRRKAKAAPDRSTKAPSSPQAVAPPRGPFAVGGQPQPAGCGQWPPLIREGRRAETAAELPAAHRYAAAVLAVFNSPEEQKRAGRFVDFHHPPLDAVFPGLAGWQDRQKLELAELGIFEVRHAANHARRALDPNYTGEVFDHRRQAWPRDDCGMLSPLGEWLLALSPEVETKLASMPPAEREDLAAVAAVLEELAEAGRSAGAAGSADSLGTSLPACELELLKYLQRLGQDERRTATELAKELPFSSSTIDKALRRLRDEHGFIDRSPEIRRGARLTPRGREAARELLQAERA